MNVVLIQPPQPYLWEPLAYVPLGLAWMGATLEEAGVEVEMMQLADCKDIEAVTFPDADWYGVSCVSANYTETKRLVEMLKDRGKVAVGGPHPSACPDDTLRDMSPDLVMRGEAEYLFRDIVTGKVKAEPVMDARYIKDLDALPLPARHLFPRDNVINVTGIHGQEKGVPATTVMTSRGCPYRCMFCCKAHEMFSYYRYREAEGVVTELIQIMDYYGVEHVRFVDDEFTVNRNKTVALMKAIKDLGLTWICITRCDSLDDELLSLMKEAGCTEVDVGVESGSNRVLQLMNKRTTTDTLLKGIEKIKAAGLTAKAYLMYNFPGETEEDRDMTVEFMRKAKPQKFTLSDYTPLPGSDLVRDSKGTDDFYYTDDAGYWALHNRIKEAAGID